MASRTLCSQRGFTYVAALMVIVIMGIMLTAAAQNWKTVMKREREKELMFRGIQIRNALVRWHFPPSIPGQHPRTKLNELKDLLKDPRTPSTVRYLRRLYKDPITGKDWNVVTDPIWGIVGVSSPSEEPPLKQGNFPAELKVFEGKARYNEWQFTVVQANTAAGNQSSVPGQPGTAAAPAQVISYFEGN